MNRRARARGLDAAHYSPSIASVIHCVTMNVNPINTANINTSNTTQYPPRPTAA